MAFLKLPENARFSNKKIILFIIPIYIELLMVALISMADTYMVSGFGEAAVAGVALASNIDKFVKQMFSGLAAGGSVVLSQYIGAQNQLGANKSLKTSIHALFMLTLVVSAVMFIFKESILSLIFGAVEADVMENALTYFSITTLSYPFVTLFNTATAAYRAMGNSKIALYTSLVMMLVSLLLKYIFIFVIKMGIVGAALSNLIAYALVGAVMILTLHGRQNKAYLTKFFKPEFEFKMMSRIFKVGIPNGVESGMFQFGLLLIQTVIATLGKNSIAAYSLTSSVTPLIHTVNGAFQLGILTFVAQCMGAEKPDEAGFYMKHIVRLNYVVNFVNASVMMILMPWIIKMYGMEPATTSLALRSFYIYTGFALFFYPLAFALPNALRGAGDTRFTMMISIITMFGIRLGMAYVFILVLKMGIYGAWLAMTLEWIVKGGIFIVRAKKGKWRTIKVIESKAETA